MSGFTRGLVRAETRRCGEHSVRAESAETVAPGRASGPSFIRDEKTQHAATRDTSLRPPRALREKASSPSLRAFASSRESKALAALLLLSACAQQVASGVQPAAPGFLLGVWHGFIFPVAWVLSLVMPDVAIYAVPNNGGWYDFGFFIGVVFLGVGSNKGRTVVRGRPR